MEEVESTCVAGNFLNTLLQRVVCKLNSLADATCSSWRSSLNRLLLNVASRKVLNLPSVVWRIFCN
eukprot:c14952_g1_i1 orf=61-258(+)